MGGSLIQVLPNTGNHSCCHIKSLHMVLQFWGENIPLPKFVPLSTFHFGFLYINDGKSIVPSFSGCPCQECQSFLTEQLGYAYEILSGEFEDVWPKIIEYVTDNKPILIGPLPMELYRQYNPQIPPAGLDTFGVVCGYDKDGSRLFLTDTFGLSYVPINREDLASGWEKGKRLCPPELIPHVPYLLIVKERVKPYQELEVADNALKRACQLLKGRKISDSLYLGLEGQKKLCEDLKRGFNLEERKLRAVTMLLRDFVFFAGAQSRGDFIYFLHDYSSKLPSFSKKDQILKLVGVYEQEHSLFLDCLKLPVLTLSGVEAGGEISPHLPTLHEKLSKMVELEEEALYILSKTHGE